jgi:anaerobic ribonucleoside-triphosphate reductase
MSDKHVKGVKCPNCGSYNTYGMSRVCGYFSRINNWNAAKKAEFRDRQGGDYDVED